MRKDEILRNLHLYRNLLIERNNLTVKYNKLSAIKDIYAPYGSVDNYKNINM